MRPMLAIATEYFLGHKIKKACYPPLWQDMSTFILALLHMKLSHIITILSAAGAQ